MKIIGDKATRGLSLTLIAVAFLLWGFLRSLDDILIPVFQRILNLSYSSAMLVHLSFFSAYLVASLPAGRLIEWKGYRFVLIWATLLMAAGSAGFISVAWRTSFVRCLCAILIEAIGITLLQVAANPLIALFGSPESAARRLLLAHMFISLGSVSGPLLGQALLPVKTTITVAHAQFPSHLVIALYGTAATALLTVAAMLRFVLADPVTPTRSPLRHQLWSLLRKKTVLLGFAAIFLAVGAEAAVLGHIVTFLSSPTAGGFQPRTSAILLSGYWAAVMTGRLAGAQLLRRFNTRSLLRIAALCAFFVTLLAFSVPGRLTGIVLLSDGLFNSIMFPAIFVLTIADIPQSEIPTTSGLLTTAICGGAAIPPLSGIFADHFGVAAAFLLPTFCYLCIAAYAANLRRSRPASAV